MKLYDPYQQFSGKGKWRPKKRGNEINEVHYLRNKNLKTHTPDLDRWLVEMEREIWCLREALPLVLSGKRGDLKPLIKFVTCFTWKFPPALQQEAGLLQ